MFCLQPVYQTFKSNLIQHLIIVIFNYFQSVQLDLSLNGNGNEDYKRFSNTPSNNNNNAAPCDLKLHSLR